MVDDRVVFHWCYMNDSYSLREYLEDGGDPHLSDRYGDTLLHEASRENAKECVELLLNCKVSPNIQNQNGDTPLHLSAQYKAGECLELLLKHGANPSLFNKIKDTPLHRAARNNCKRCMELLLSYGADYSMKNIKEHTFIEGICSESTRIAMQAFLEELDVFNIKEPSC